ncbi:MAG: hypothetical protein PVG99_09390 [Desulfobacteraceae bacterium]|jgi:hypothetical protein
MKNQKDKYKEDDVRLDLFEEFAPQVREVLRRYREKRKLSSIARQLGFHPSRLTEMITKNNNADYKRKITPYYLGKFLDSGIMDPKEILGHRRLEDLPDRVRIFFERLSLSRKTLHLVLEAQRRGIDLDMILEEILYPKTKR